jgi:hypothetical protein
MTYHHGKVKPQGQRKTIEGLSKFIGGKMERNEKVCFPSHSIGHQVLDLPSPPFLLLFKRQTWIMGNFLFPWT